MSIWDQYKSPQDGPKPGLSVADTLTEHIKRLEAENKALKAENASLKAALRGDLSDAGNAEIDEPRGYGIPQRFEGTLPECRVRVRRPAPQMGGFKTSAGSEPAYATQYLRGEDPPSARDSEKAAIISWLESRLGNDPDNSNFIERLISGLRDDEHGPWRTP